MVLVISQKPRKHISLKEFLLQKTDRKSTRLNSSHVRISYAVFCLKKKKKNKKQTRLIPTGDRRPDYSGVHTVVGAPRRHLRIAPGAASVHQHHLLLHHAPPDHAHH